MNSFYLFLLLVSPTLTLQPDEPLILTPLLKQGKYREAQEISLIPSLVPGAPYAGYSGFFQIDEIAKTNLFFWFHPKESCSNWKDAPLILWLVDGLGVSSFRAALQENVFPFNVTQDGIVGRFDLALTRFANLLIIDNTNIGFSHTNDQSIGLYSLDQMAEQHYSVLEQFFILFPDLERSVFLSGVSSGVTKAIHLANLILKRDRHVVDLRGLIAGDGFRDVEQLSKIGDYYYYFGFLEKKKARKIDDILDELRALLKTNDIREVWNSVQNDLYSKAISEPTGKIGQGLEDITKPFRNDDRWIDFITTPEVRTKLHVGHINFILDLETPKTLLGPEFFIKQNLDSILNEGIPYFTYHGQYDGLIPYQSSIKSLQDTNWFEQKCFQKEKFQRKQIWVSGKLFGYVRQCLQVWEVFVLNVGHIISLDVPEPLWEVFNRFLKTY